MRVIKFRVWDKERKVMYHLLEDRFSFGRDEGERAASWEDIFAEQREELIPLQFTGLLDKDGKEIYEGDIVSVNYGKCHTNPLGLNRIGKVIFDKRSAAFQVKIKDSAVQVSFGIVHKCEVIGDIHENPELLERTNEIP